MWKKWGGGSKGGIRGKGHKSKNKAHTAAGKAGVSKGHSIGAGTYGGLSGTKTDWCDMRPKTDIAPLERTEVNNDLAELAFFVKELRVK